MLKVPTLYLLAAVLSLVASPALAATSMADRIAACGPGTKVLGNATIEADGHALQYSVLHCPESKPPARIVRDNSAELEARQSAELDARQTCTQCPCANGSIQCFCSNIPGQFLDSLFMYSCSHSQPPSPTRPVAANCKTLSQLMLGGVPAVQSPNLPVSVNGYYNVPVNTILTWQYQGCGFAFFNDVGSSYNVCALDLAHSVNALAAYCTDNENIEALFQNDPFKSLLVFNPAELSR